MSNIELERRKLPDVKEYEVGHFWYVMIRNGPPFKDAIVTYVVDKDSDNNKFWRRTV